VLIRGTRLSVRLVHAYCVDKSRLTRRNELLVYMHVNVVPVERTRKSAYGLHMVGIKVIDPMRPARFVIINRNDRRYAEGYEWLPQHGWQRQMLIVSSLRRGQRSISNIANARQWVMETKEQQPEEFCEVQLSFMQLGLSRV
jgi:hypothetical protein